MCTFKTLFVSFATNKRRWNDEVAREFVLGKSPRFFERTVRIILSNMQVKNKVRWEGLGDTKEYRKDA